MSSLIPISGYHVAPHARAAVAHIEPAVSSPSDDDRGWARAQTRSDTESGERSRVETVLPPDRTVDGARGTHSARYRHGHGGWPSAAFFAQHLSQEALPEEAAIRDTAATVAKYPSLDFDSEILLPGEVAAYHGAGPLRVDITV